MSSAREKLLAAVTRRYKNVETSAGTFRIQSLTQREHAVMEMAAINKKTAEMEVAKLPEVKLKRLVAHLVDEEGNVLFQPDEWKLLENLQASVINKLTKACNEIDEDDFDELAKEQLGNFESAAD